MENMLYKANMALYNGAFSDPLEAYTQTNNTSSIVNQKMRIYRPPNIAANNSQWGGLRLRGANLGLTKGHTYIILIDITGHSDGIISDPYWTNNMGWGGGGLDPTPSNVEYYSPVVAGFSSTTPVTMWYKWTINDDVYKVCTSSYGGFVAGSTYLSYCHFAYGFGYTATGTNGTELFLNNFRMYDITNTPNLNVSKEGLLCSGIAEGYDKTKVFRGNNIETSQIYEY